jgi:hypothetical protein
MLIKHLKSSSQRTSQSEQITSSGLAEKYTKKRFKSLLIKNEISLSPFLQLYQAIALNGHVLQLWQDDLEYLRMAEQTAYQVLALPDIEPGRMTAEKDGRKKSSGGIPPFHTSINPSKKLSSIDSPVIKFKNINPGAFVGSRRGRDR